MGYYELAKEARQFVADARRRRKERKQASETKEGPIESAEEEVHLWEMRLRELGVRVADTMVEMGDLELAGKHLESLRSEKSPSLAHSKDSERLKLMEALIWLRVGDLGSARRCLSSISTSDPETESKNIGILEALVKTAEGDFPAAVEMWTALRDSYEKDALIAQNLAVCLIYIGQMQEARELLISLHDNDEEVPFQALTFNLATMYELCTERNREKKIAMASRDAQRAPRDDGWEGVNLDYKL